MADDLEREDSADGEMPSVELPSVDDRFRSLMEGLRTTLPGAQVLVAFLLVLPLQAEFNTLGDIELAAYYTAFAAALLASVLLIAPSVHQRVRSPVSGLTRQTEAHLDAAVRLTIVGTALLLVALTCVAYLVTSLIANDVAAVAAAAIIAATAGYTWFYQPLIGFGLERSDPTTGEP